MPQLVVKGRRLVEGSILGPQSSTVKRADISPFDTKVFDSIWPQCDCQKTPSSAE